MLELAERVELFDKIMERSKLNEVEAKLHFYQIAAAGWIKFVGNPSTFLLFRISAIETSSRRMSFSAPWKMPTPS